MSFVSDSGKPQGQGGAISNALSQAFNNVVNNVADRLSGGLFKGMDLGGWIKENNSPNQTRTTDRAIENNEAQVQIRDYLNRSDQSRIQEQTRRDAGTERRIKRTREQLERPARENGQPAAGNPIQAQGRISAPNQVIKPQPSPGQRTTPTQASNQNAQRGSIQPSVARNLGRQGPNANRPASKATGSNREGNIQQQSTTVPRSSMSSQGSQATLAGSAQASQSSNPNSETRENAQGTGGEVTSSVGGPDYDIQDSQDPTEEEGGNSQQHTGEQEESDQNNSQNEQSPNPPPPTHRQGGGFGRPASTYDRGEDWDALQNEFAQESRETRKKLERSALRVNPQKIEGTVLEEIAKVSEHEGLDPKDALAMIEEIGNPIDVKDVKNTTVSQSQQDSHGSRVSESNSSENSITVNIDREQLLDALARGQVDLQKQMGDLVAQGDGTHKIVRLLFEDAAASSPALRLKGREIIYNPIQNGVGPGPTQVASSQQPVKDFHRELLHANEILQGGSKVDTPRSRTGLEEAQLAMETTKPTVIRIDKNDPNKEIPDLFSFKNRLA